MKAKFVNESSIEDWEIKQDLKNLGAHDIGTTHEDYLDNKVKILDIGTGHELIKKYDDISDLPEQMEEMDSVRSLIDYFYYTRVVGRNGEVPVGTKLVYPVEYDYSSYWGL